MFSMIYYLQYGLDCVLVSVHKTEGETTLDVRYIPYIRP